MPVYLAYQFCPEQLTVGILKRLMDEYYDFEPGNGPKNAEEWFRFSEQLVQRYASGLKEEYALGDEIHLLVRAGLATNYRVKNHPLLQIYIRYHDSCPLCPDDFTGLNVWAAHSGSEGMVELINLKPEMDNYLSAIGIEYEDRSKTELRLKRPFLRLFNKFSK